MSIEAFQKQRDVIEGRIGFMDGLEERKKYHLRSQLPSALFLSALTWAIVGGTKLKGEKNIDLALEKVYKGERLTGAANHTSDTDHKLLDHTLRRNGYKDFANFLVFPAGLKMWDRVETKWAMRGMNVAPVPAPGYFDEVADFKKLPLSEDDLKILDSYETKMRFLARRSLGAMAPDWDRGKIVPFVYPEATRSDDGLIGKARKETSLYYRDGWTLPFQIKGPAEVFPKGQDFVTTLKKAGRAAIRRDFVVEVTAGELISNLMLQERATRNWLDERGANAADFVMSRVAVLDPSMVKPEFKDFYESLADSIPKGLVLRAA